MMLRLAFFDLPPHPDERGVTRIGLKTLAVVDDDDRPVENLTAMAWGEVADALVACGLFTDAHFKPGTEYCVVVFEAEHAHHGGKHEG